MTRDQLEAVIHAQLTRAWKYGLEPNGRSAPVDVILAAADTHAVTHADETLRGVLAAERRAS